MIKNFTITAEKLFSLLCVCITLSKIAQYFIHSPVSTIVLSASKYLF